MNVGKHFNVEDIEELKRRKAELQRKEREYHKERKALGLKVPPLALLEHDLLRVSDQSLLAIVRTLDGFLLFLGISFSWLIVF